MTEPEIGTYLLGADLAGFSLNAEEMIHAARTRTQIQVGRSHHSHRIALGESAWLYWLIRGWVEA